MYAILFSDIDGTINDDPAPEVAGKLIPGSREYLKALYTRVQKLLFLTARPESMRELTVAWFKNNAVPLYDNIIMKPEALANMPTPAWKAGMIRTIVELTGADVVYFVDNEQPNLDAALAAMPRGLTIARLLPELLRKLDHARDIDGTYS